MDNNDSNYNLYLVKEPPVSPSRILFGNVTATNVGSGGVQGLWKFGPNGRIVINDGTNDRVLIGNLD